MVVLREVKVLTHLILEVTDVCARAMPASYPCFSLLVRIDGHFHAVVEHGVWLVVVQYVKFDGDACPRIGDFEVEPLRMTQSVSVILHQKIVLLLTDFRR